MAIIGFCIKEICMKGGTKKTLGFKLITGFGLIHLSPHMQDEY